MTDFNFSDAGFTLSVSWFALGLIILTMICVSIIILRSGRLSNQISFISLGTWFNRHYVLVILLGGFAGVGLALNFYLLEIMGIVAGLVDRLRTSVADGTESTDDLRNLAYATAVLLAAVVAGATLVFTLIKVWVNERTTRTTEDGHITDRIAKAVEQIGADKIVKSANGEESQPNLEVRMGGLLALERIARDSLPDHVQVMEILCAYIREAAHDQQRREPVPTYDPGKYDGIQLNWAFSHRRQPRADLKIALQILGRRNRAQILRERAEQYIPDISRTNFTCINLLKANFEGVLMAGCNLTGADLCYANLNGANLTLANLQAADLSFTDLRGTKVFNASLRVANMYRVSVDENTDFSRSVFLGAGLSFEGVPVLELSKEQCLSAFGDKAEALNKILPCPEHWHKDDLDLLAFNTQWLRWCKQHKGLENPERSA